LFGARCEFLRDPLVRPIAPPLDGEIQCCKRIGAALIAARGPSRPMSHQSTAEVKKSPHVAGQFTEIALEIWLRG
jgi:hypothetical protein